MQACEDPQGVPSAQGECFVWHMAWPVRWPEHQRAAHTNFLLCQKDKDSNPPTKPLTQNASTYNMYRDKDRAETEE